MEKKIRRISVIVPLYYGQKYLEQLRVIIGDAAMQVQESAEIEWIISNDCPEEKISDIDEKDNLRIIILNSNANRGIQGARIRGLEVATGEYVLFLDQDDYISPDYFKSQLKEIGNADAVVCDAINDNQPMYPSGDRTTLEEGITKEFNLSVGCGFYPGQVLIKKHSIPRVWTENILVNNSCDDYYLWLCMFSNGCRFKANSKVLYEHIITGDNQGSDGYSWYKSTMEMLEIVINKNLFNYNEEEKLKKSVKKSIGTVLKDKKWVQEKNEILNKLILLYEKEETIMREGDLYEKGIGIYGYKIGIRIYRYLRRQGIDVQCFVDRNKDIQGVDIPVYASEDIPQSVGLIINTIIRDKESVERFIHNKYPKIEVMSATDFLDKLMKA